MYMRIKTCKFIHDTCKQKLYQLKVGMSLGPIYGIRKYSSWCRYFNTVYCSIALARFSMHIIFKEV